MAKIEDLIRRISDDKLREEIATEVRELKRRKQFGLVFEEHLPEMLRLPQVPIRLGNLVVERDAPGNDLWRVIAITGKKAKCRQPMRPEQYDEEKTREFPLDELVLVVSFGEPIYPVLTPVDRIARAGPDKPWHILINADNFHALQLLLYAYERKVDVIYIDPPYNTGARDWKYNNDYVDKTDAWRHSKWLSMMRKRLLLAKRLLKADGVLIVTIDENEVHHLRCLLGSLFVESALQQTTVVVNPKGVTQGRFSRVEEFVLFAFGQNMMPEGRADDYLTPEPDEGFENVAGTRPRWKGLLRSGTNARRVDRDKMFYPVLIDDARRAVVGVGESLPLDKEPDLGAKINGYAAAWPVRSNGQWGNWGVGHITLRHLISNGFVGVGEYDPKRKTWALFYLSQQLREQLESGVLEIVAFDKERNVVDVRYASIGARRIKTVWKRSRHDAGVHGSDLVKKILGRTEAFSFPKSLYAVDDTIYPFVRTRPNALVMDFFCGTATTFHALALMNRRDGGRRQCICVTNNEVSEERHRELQALGFHPGHATYEENGVANAVSWPRCKYVIQGYRDDGAKLPGDYLDGMPFSNGFEENMEYLRLDFVNPVQVERGDAFEGILPILWLVAGAIGERESRRGSTPWYVAKHSCFAVLIQETKFREFRHKLKERNDIKHVFLVSDSDDNFAMMRTELGRKYHCVQLYKSYLENFRINTVDPHTAGKDVRED